MSTTEPFLQAEEIEEFIRETKIAPQFFYGYEDRELGICPFITFYVFHNEEQFLDVADAMISVYEEFATLVDEPFRRIYRHKTQTWLDAGHRNLPADLRPEARNAQTAGRRFSIGATDATSEAASPLWSAYADVNQYGVQAYSQLKLIFRNKWYQQNKQRWYDFVHRSLLRLQPEQCYSGFEVGNPGFNFLGSYEADVLERICADHFYGMDIDHPLKMGYHSYGRDDGLVDPSDLGAGLRPPTWCFLLTPIWRKKLGKTQAQVLAELDDPRVQITALPQKPSAHNPQGKDALWIRLGELDLHPVEDGVPDLLVKANALIRPIRCDDLELLTLHPWDDDPNPRFDTESSLRWMRRFDADSDWPSAEQRTPPPRARLRCEAGQPCPREGFWYTPAQADSRRFFKAGEPMPEIGGDYGATIWQWDENQVAPRV